MILSPDVKDAAFKISAEILKLCQKISWAKLGSGALMLRRMHNIKTIQASLAIEGNTLSIEQITAIFAGKRVIGPNLSMIS